MHRRLDLFVRLFSSPFSRRRISCPPPSHLLDYNEKAEVRGSGGRDREARGTRACVCGKTPLGACFGDATLTIFRPGRCQAHTLTTFSTLLPAPCPLPLPFSPSHLPYRSSNGFFYTLFLGFSDYVQGTRAEYVRERMEGVRRRVRYVGDATGGRPCVSPAAAPLGSNVLGRLIMGFMHDGCA